VIIAAAADRPLPGVAGTILSAPAVWGGDQLGPFYRATLWVAVRLAPSLTLTGRNLDVLPSDNLAMLRELGRDPLVIKETRVDAVAGLVDLMDRAVRRIGALRGPLLVLGGAHDEIVPPEAHAACTEVVYPDGYHMLLRDLRRQVVWDDILAWIAGAALPSGLAEPCAAGVTPVAAALR